MIIFACRHEKVLQAFRQATAQFSPHINVTFIVMCFGLTNIVEAGYLCSSFLRCKESMNLQKHTEKDQDNAGESFESGTEINSLYLIQNNVDIVGNSCLSFVCPNDLPSQISTKHGILHLQ
jgi:hypothetical protein